MLAIYTHCLQLQLQVQKLWLFSGILRALALSAEKEPPKKFLFLVLVQWYLFQKFWVSSDSVFYRAKKLFLEKCTKLRTFGKRILVIFSRSPSPRKWILWTTNGLKYIKVIKNFSGSFLHRIFEFENFRAPFSRKNSLNCERLNFRKS